MGSLGEMGNAAPGHGKREAQVEVDELDVGPPAALGRNEER